MNSTISLLVFCAPCETAKAVIRYCTFIIRTLGREAAIERSTNTTTCVRIYTTTATTIADIIETVLRFACGTLTVAIYEELFGSIFIREESATTYGYRKLTGNTELQRNTTNIVASRQTNLSFYQSGGDLLRRDSFPFWVCGYAYASTTRR